MAPDTKDRTVIETLLPSQMEIMTVVDNETNGSRNYRRWFLVLGGVIVCLAVAAGLICFLLPASPGKKSSSCQGQECQTKGPKLGRAMTNYDQITKTTSTTTTTTTTTTTSICSSGTWWRCTDLLVFAAWIGAKQLKSWTPQGHYVRTCPWRSELIGAKDWKNCECCPLSLIFVK